MKNRIKNIWNRNRWYLVLLGSGVFLGWLFFHSPVNNKDLYNEGQVIQNDHEHEDEEGTIWTCSMHPQIRQDKPGKCPICGMDLIPLSSSGSGGVEMDPDEIRLTESAAKLADIQTLIVSRRSPEKEIFLQGKVQADERRIAQLTARFGGRIEKLFVSFTGENVTKGQELATIYSPELITAQKELQEAVSYKETRPSIYNAARAKLKLWDLTEQQIDDIENNGKPKTYFNILSPISGTVTERNVALGDYVKEGSVLFKVIDLSHVWILFDAYESDLQWINRGDKATYTIQSLPGKEFKGEVVFIDPYIDPVTRVAKVRVERDNPSLSLKPEMFVNGTVESQYAGKTTDILIPKTSILWTGKRAVVYVKVPGRDQPTFRYREIVLGPESGDFYVVSEGLSEGEEIAVNGVFKIDAAAQLEGKPSMMNPEGGKVAKVHNHGSVEGAGTEMVSDHEPMNSSNESTNGDHESVNAGHDSKNDSGHQSGEPDPALKKQLQDVFDAYIPMKNAFVASDAEEIQKRAQLVRDNLQAVDMELLKGDAHMKWMGFLEVMNPEISAIGNAADLSKQRIAFAKFNDAFYGALETFGLQHGTVYYQYCPMAIESKGAYWLSEIEEIRNPYFGDEMISCGETRDSLTFNEQTNKM